MCDWQERTLRDLVGSPISGSRPSGGVREDTEGVPSLGGENVLAEGGMTYEVLKRIPHQFFALMSKGKLRDGDVLINKDGAQTGKVGLYAGEFDHAAVNEHLFILRSPNGEIDQRFLYYSLLRRDTQAAIARQVTGSAQPGLGSTFVDHVRVALPTHLDEQHCIARLLLTLDAAIHETEAIIAKLKAVKQGLLHDLLTRGIDASGELRPPQAEVQQLYKQSPLGWIPKEWDIATLEAVSATVTSGSRDWARFYADSGALFVRIGNLTREHINFRFDSTIYVRPPRNADGQRTRLEPSDILISITADLGIVGVVPDGMGEAYINQHIALVRPSHGVVNPRFVGHYLASPAAQTYISKLNDAGAKAGLNLPTVRGLLTARPARTEQDLIAERLDEIDHRIQNAATESAKLRELKAGLMDDLLTGRVRVTPLLADAKPEKEPA